MILNSISHIKTMKEHMTTATPNMPYDKYKEKNQNKGNLFGMKLVALLNDNSYAKSHAAFSCSFKMSDSQYSHSHPTFQAARKREIFTANVRVSASFLNLSIANLRYEPANNLQLLLRSWYIWCGRTDKGKSGFSNFFLPLFGFL